MLAPAFKTEKASTQEPVAYSWHFSHGSRHVEPFVAGNLPNSGNSGCPARSCTQNLLCLPWYPSFFLLEFLFSLGPAGAQENSGAAANRETPAAKKTAVAKQPAATNTEVEVETRGESKNEEQDGPEELRKRAEWFYKQRASAKGHIAAGKTH